MLATNALKNTINKPKIDEFKQGFVEIFGQILNKVISDKPMFNINDFSGVFFDEYSLGTACHKDIFATFYLEIDEPNNYKPSRLKSSNKKEKRICMPNLYVSLDDFKKSIFDESVKILDSNNLIWLEDNAICYKMTAYDEEIGSETYNFRVIPTITHYNDKNIRGILYKQSDGINIEFPDLALENFYNKNELTNNLYKEIVLIFKNILLSDKSIKTLPSEIIETVLYNVPNDMFKDDSEHTLINMINYLRNKNATSFVTLDEQDNAFSSLYRSMSIIYVKHILKIIEKYIMRAR